MAQFERPLFSVIIRTIGRFPINRCLDSIVHQTLDKKLFEVVIVNDGGSRIELDLEGYFKVVSIKYIHLSQNEGKSVAANTAVNASQGQYLTFLDDDDIYYPLHLEVLYNYLLKSGEVTISVLYTDTDLAIDSENGKTVVGVHSWNFEPAEIAMMHNCLIICSCCVSKKAWDSIGGFDLQFSNVLDDWDFFVRLSHKYNFHHINNITTQYSVPNGNKSFSSVSVK